MSESESLKHSEETYPVNYPNRAGLLGVVAVATLAGVPNANADTISVSNPLERAQIARAYVIGADEWESERPGSTTSYACKGRIDTAIVTPQELKIITGGQPAYAATQQFPTCKISFSIDLFGNKRPPGFQCAIAKHELGHMLFGPNHVLNNPRNVMTDTPDPQYMTYYSKGCSTLNTSLRFKPREELDRILDSYGYTASDCRTKPKSSKRPNEYLCVGKDEDTASLVYYDLKLKSGQLYRASGELRDSAYESEVVSKRDWQKNRRAGGKIIKNIVHMTTKDIK